jgi:beta-glucanase (GH16 family)
VTTEKRTSWRTTHVNTVPPETAKTGTGTVKTTPGPNPGTYGTTTAAPGSLIFEDNFDTFNFQHWKHELTMGGGGNWEFEVYHNNRTTSFVRDGILHIQPGFTSQWFGINGEAMVQSQGSLDMWGSTPADACTGNAFYGCRRVAGAGGNYLNPITSARLRTAEHFSFRYGRIEVRAKLPRGDWLWPAIWLLPRDNEYGNWPSSGEIDICESRGNMGYPSQYGGGPETFGTTLHFGPAYNADPYQKAHKTYTLPSGTFNDDFHVFGFVWTADRMYSYLDTDDNRVLDLPINEDFWTLGNFPEPYTNPWVASPNKNAPFDKEFYLILNLAVGGTSGYFPDGVGGKPWTNSDGHAVNNFYNSKGQWYPTWDQKGSGSALQVDYVRVWAL